jgi:hypothetical protein
MCFFIFVPFGYLFPVCGQTLRDRKSARKERRKYDALLINCRVRRQTFRPAKIFPTALVTLRALLAKAEELARPRGAVNALAEHSWNPAWQSQQHSARSMVINLISISSFLSLAHM